MLSHAEQNKVIERLIQKADNFSGYATLYLALLTAEPDPGNPSSFSEATYTGYNRVAVTASDFDAAADGVMANATAFSFGENTWSNEDVSHVALMDAASGGNVVCYGELPAPYTVNVGIDPTYPIGTLSIGP